MRGHRCISDFNTSESWIIHNLHSVIRATMQIMVTLPSSSSWIKWCAKLAVGRVLTTTRTRRLRTPADTDAPPDIVFSWLSYYGDHVGGAYLSHDIRGVAGSTRLHIYSYRWAFYSVNSYPACSSQEVLQRGKVGAGRLVQERAYINCVCKCVSICEDLVPLLPRNSGCFNSSCLHLPAVRWVTCTVVGSLCGSEDLTAFQQWFPPTVHMQASFLWT